MTNSPLDRMSTEDLRARIDALTLRDRPRLGRRLDGLARPTPGGDRDSVERLTADVADCELRVLRRRGMVPQIEFPPALPITERLDELRDHLTAHQVVIVSGETGSGKSTQIPKLCLQLGRGVLGLIGHTQPRRLAARAIAERVAEELRTTVGAAVGYAVRFSDNVGEDTLVKVMTDGILLAETRRDRQLLAYDTLIIDEAHDRSLNVDFLLGYLKQLLPRRPDLKVVITSATIDTAKFSQHFGDAPIVEVSGRAHPVELRYRPYGEERDDDRDQVQALGDALQELASEGPGDVLVFMSGEREIHDAADALRRMQLPDTEVLPLYARLGTAEQRRIFQPHRDRRIVLSTNVAETSLTVPGIRYVIDVGTARISRYNRRLKVQRLPIEAVSRASANQRAGRCGRQAPGICIRLYSEEDFAARDEFTQPEILRTNLASVVLQGAALDLGDIASFPFVDPPDARAIKDGVALLEELGAFNAGEQDPYKQLTPLGRRLSRLPIDPRLGRMVLEAERNDCLREVTIIAAALSIQDPRERPADAQAAADALHARFAEDGSDFLAYLRLWDHVRELQRDRTKGDFRRKCRAEYLNYLRVREWQDLNRQLRDVTAELDIPAGHPNRDAADPERVHRSLLAGLLSQIGVRATSEREFNGARNARFVLAPGSILAKKPPNWVMAAEMVETNRLWGRVAARIQPEWVERIGAHLCKHTYSDPRWDPGRGAVVATERVTMYGLAIVPGRTIDYARIDPAGARELFIRHALVEREWTTRHAFLEENARQMQQIRALEDRARRRDLLIGDDEQFAFYDARIPSEVTSGRDLDRWMKQDREKRNEVLTYTPDQLLNADAQDVSLSEFPDSWEQGDRRFPLSYRFEPGAVDDGVTVHIPLVALRDVPSDGFDWMVAGRRPELVAALLRTLPKSTRRHLVPLAENVVRFLDQCGPGDGSLLDVLSRYVTETVRRNTHGVIANAARAADFDLTRVPDHARMTFSIEDQQDRPIAAGKDLDALGERLAGKVRSAIAEAVPITEHHGLRSWSIGMLPQVVETRDRGHVVRGYPALMDERDSVGVRVLTNAATQRRAMRSGTIRLLALNVTPPRKQLERLVSTDARLALARCGLGGLDRLVEDSITCVLTHLLDVHGGPVWDGAGFEALLDHVRGDLTESASTVLKDAARVVMAAAAVGVALERFRAPAFDPAVADIRQQLRWLVHPGFVASTSASQMADVWRYVRAIETRLEKLVGNVDRDRAWMQAARRLQDEVDDLLLGADAASRPAVLEVRWMVEELRVSLFAQSLGTPNPVSEPRIRRELARLVDSG